MTNDREFIPRFNPSPISMDKTQFIETFGGVYEHTPWIAEYVWNQGISSDHETPEGLSHALMAVLKTANKQQLLTLINAHPDLAGKAAVDGNLTAESKSEQSGAGIDQCTVEEFERFKRLNLAYKDKFGFPFIMAVKGSNRHKILEAFEVRLHNNEEQEFQQALAEINNIARFRLDEIAEGT